MSFAHLHAALTLTYMKLNLPKIEKKILRFWKQKKIFEKSLKKTRRGKKFVFFEGPPFANGLPGIHHLLARAFKDIILRYKTMQGFYIERKAGWDTHGLPTEMEAEKKLGIKTKKEIEELGIEKFIAECKRNVFTYKKEWEEFTERIGFWLDLKRAYITCSNDYIESLWWILKEIWEKGLLYQDSKVVPYCPRCGTSLSSHEVAQGYKTIKENSIYIKFPIKNKENTYFLVWTTTPWTLPGNVALAVGKDVKYVKIKLDNEYFILAADRLKIIGKKVKIIEKYLGKDLLGLEYKPIFDFIKPDKKAYYLISGDFVSTKEGTGIVHVAPAFGEEDMEVGKKNNLPILMTVDENGSFKPEVKKWEGKFVKKADPLIIEDFKNRDLLFKEELYEHEYPFCWRCDAPLLYYAKTSWFIKMTALKKDLIENNKKINWIPEYLKEGRFGEWLKEVKDWNLSRERYWGTPLPIWQCQKCKKQICVGSVKELTQKSRKKIKDLHRPFIDKINFRCQCGGLMRRVPEVIDCWFDSGAMPFAQWHYPFENRARIKKGISFPADFICEGIDQTRGWFYTLLAVSTVLGLGHSYKNVISHGIVLDAKGQKMSKSKGNVISPPEVIDKFGADCARFYFYTINPVGEPKRFNFRDLQDLYRRFFDTWWNSFIFFSTYTDKKPKSNFKPKKSLDCWIVSRLHSLNEKLVKGLDKYYVVEAARLFEDFVNDLSNWYIRRSRKRFQKLDYNPPTTSEVPFRRVEGGLESHPSLRSGWAPNAKEKEEASQTLYYVLLNFAKLMAPFTPFFAEEMYQKLVKNSKPPESIHLSDYPKPNKKLINKKLEKKMGEVREVVKEALSQRANAGIKVRQPLAKLIIKNYELKNKKELLELIQDEVNVKKITFGKSLKLDTRITPELKEEGMVREVIRQIQEMRKKAKLKPKDKVISYISGTPGLNKILARNKDFILKTARLKELKLEGKPKRVFDIEQEAEIDKQKLWLAIRKIKKRSKK